MAFVIHAKEGTPFVIEGGHLQFEQVYARLEILMELDGKHTNCAITCWQDLEAYDRQPSTPLNFKEQSEEGEISVGFKMNYEFVLDAESGDQQSMALMMKLVAEEISVRGYEVVVQDMYKHGETFDKNELGAVVGEFPDAMIGDGTIESLEKSINFHQDSIAKLNDQLKEAVQNAEEKAEKANDEEIGENEENVA